MIRQNKNGRIGQQFSTHSNDDEHHKNLFISVPTFDVFTDESHNKQKIRTESTEVLTNLGLNLWREGTKIGTCVDSTTQISSESAGKVVHLSRLALERCAGF